MPNFLGLKTMTSAFLAPDTIYARDGETLRKFIWTANALADQEREIERLRSHVSSLEESLRVALEERAEAVEELDKLKALDRCGICDEPGRVDESGACPDCAAELAEAAANPPTPEQESERKKRIDLWFCDEPGCDVLGHDHEGPHAKMISLGDVDRLEWTRPGAYLDALRPLRAIGKGE